MFSIIYKYLLVNYIAYYSFIFFFAIFFYSGNLHSSQTDTMEPSKSVSIDNIRNSINHLVSFGNRTEPSKQWSAAIWINEKFKENGLYSYIHTYKWKGETWPNVICTIKGTSFPSEKVLLIAHLDSITRNSDNIAPGADDNASGVAVIIETARLLKDTIPKHSIQFCIFSNEEKGSIGSQNFVKGQLKQKKKVTSVINLDAIGYKPKSLLFLFDAFKAHDKLKYKLKATYRMFYNIFLKILGDSSDFCIYGQNVNAKLVAITSSTIENHSDLKVKQTVADDCG